MGVGKILADHVAWLALDFLLLPNYFNTSSARRSCWFHYVHVLKVFSFTIHTELSVFVGEEVGLGTEIVLGKKALHSSKILIH